MIFRPTSRAPFSQEPVNFRPIGLLRSGESRLRAGALFRCGLAASRPAAIDQLLIHNRIALVVDLRSRVEIDDQRLLQPRGVQWEHWPLEGRPSRTDKFDCRARVYAAWYEALAVSNAASIANIFARLADLECPPCLVCCHAGKDRTGVLVTLLLGLLGYSRAEIVYEYELSGRLLLQSIDRFERDWIRNGMTRAGYELRLRPSGEAVLMFLEALDANSGGAEMLLRASGLSTGRIASLRRRLTVRS